MIARKDNPNDGKKSADFFLSDTAKVLQEVATQITQNINAGALSVLDNNEKQAFIEIMNKVLAKQKEMMLGREFNPHQSLGGGK